jgi:hypothetical protein
VIPVIPVCDGYPSLLVLGKKRDEKRGEPGEERKGKEKRGWKGWKRSFSWGFCGVLY